MGELGALFNPGMRHELEERRARAARREEEGNARDGDLRIDLESGVAVINAPDNDEAAAEEQASAAAAEEPGSAAADSAPDTAPTQEEEDGSPSETASDDSGEARPASPRPRGKRGLAASKR
jgi:hypothetical protein